MATITASMVMKLRENSGLPMMDCKRALTETDGDAEAAMELLRKSGAAAAEKKAGRETTDGRLVTYLDKEKQVAALVEIQCETAPTSNNPVFRELVEKVAKHVALTGDANLDTLENEAFVDDPNKTIKDLVHDTVNVIRENMKISRVIRVNGRIGSYVHHDGRVGVLLTVEGDGGDDALLTDVCMHVAAMQPAAIHREDVPADLVEKEKAFAKEQILAAGKPEHLIEKILTGKMNRWFSERVLVEQAFVKDDKMTVGDLVKSAGLKIISASRLKVGEA